MNRIEFKEEYSTLFFDLKEDRLKTYEEVRKEVFDLLDSEQLVGMDLGWLKWAIEYLEYSSNLKEKQDG